MLSRFALLSRCRLRCKGVVVQSRFYRPSRSLLASHAIVQHRDTAINNQSLPFEFNAESKQKIAVILKKYPSNYKQSAVIPLLTLAQEQNDNWLPISAMDKVAEVLDVPPMRVYEVATFYSQFNREPVGKFHIQLCGTTPCQLCGAEQIREAIENHLGIEAGETTEDGMFTLSEVECLGACVNAPMIQVNNHEYYENLTPQSMIKLIEDWKAGKKPNVGPQNGQRDCEGPSGATTLASQPEPFKPFRDLSAMEKEHKDNEAKAAGAPQQPPQPPQAPAPPQPPQAPASPPASSPKTAPPAGGKKEDSRQNPPAWKKK